MEKTEALRREIDRIDDQMAVLFIKRMEIVNKIVKTGEKKKIEDIKRKKEIFNRLLPRAEKFHDEYEAFLKKVIEISEDYQRK